MLRDDGMSVESAERTNAKNGNSKTAVPMTGRAMLAVYVANLILKAPASTTFVELEETRSADAMLAIANSVYVHTLLCSMLLDIRVMYAKKAVPVSTSGSLPLMEPSTKNNVYT